MDECLLDVNTYRQLLLETPPYLTSDGVGGTIGGPAGQLFEGGLGRWTDILCNQ